jgi:hypothetical protein
MDVRRVIDHRVSEARPSNNPLRVGWEFIRVRWVDGPGEGVDVGAANRCGSTPHLKGHIAAALVHWEDGEARLSYNDRIDSMLGREVAEIDESFDDKRHHS